MILDNIRKKCTVAGLSTCSLERTLGFGNGTIGKWESSSPSVDKLKRVADFFGVTVDELLMGDSDSSVRTEGGKGNGSQESTASTAHR